ncbi:MAG: hypothetical protein NTZ44_01195 [Candidatus Nomurabacteria bacterium]|nr:hypothetical protein [Candidatus Nomurabacteria bacterium]
MALSAKATQEFVPIKEVRDGIVVMKDGQLRAIVLANSTNLSLKSEEEQKATIMQFQSFLNTIDFPIQIVVQSRRLDIRPYLLLLENRMKAQTEPLLKIQTKEYMQFIRNFTETTNIMTKNFFIIVPYSVEKMVTSSSGGIFSRFFSKQTKAMEKEAQTKDFEEKRSQLDQRIGVIEQGLARCGIKSVELGTEEVVEVFYKVFNPGEIEGKINLSQGEEKKL